MFKKIYIILIILILNSCAKELELTEDGIFEKDTSKLITEQIKFNEAVSYYFDIINNSPIYGNYIFYEELNNFKKSCYIPIINYDDLYTINKIICFELSFPYNSTPYWYSTQIDLNKKYNLNEIDIKNLIYTQDKEKVQSVYTYDSKIDEKESTIKFPKLRLYNSNNSVISEEAIFKIKIYNDLVYFNIEDIILN